MKTLVLGAGGMAGHVIAQYLREHNYQVDTLSAKNAFDDDTYILDVTNKAKLEEFLASHSYDIVINCIGVLVKQSEEQKDRSVYLNSYLPHFLEMRYKNEPTKVIHLSTDCVFSGDNAPYKEDSMYDGELFYDRTKALGEIKNDKDLTFRMSIVGPDMQPAGIGLFNWFYAQHGEINGFTAAIWSGITTIELARGIEAAIEQNLTGLYHLVPNQNISKFNLVTLFKDAFSRGDITIKSVDGPTIDKTLINTRSDFKFTVSDYPTMVKEMKNWVYSHKNLYEHYREAAVR